MKQLQIRKTGNRREIFDVVRKKYVAATPEELVRQRLIHYLIDERGHPKGLIAVEKEIDLYGLSRRCDIVVYSKEGMPLLIAECKAPEVNIDQKVFDQIARYNMSLNVEFIIVTNGTATYCAQLEKDKYRFLNEIPMYRNL